MDKLPLFAQQLDSCLRSSEQRLQHPLVRFKNSLLVSFQYAAFGFFLDIFRERLFLFSFSFIGGACTVIWGISNDIAGRI
jgi:hypothetical protein